MKLVYEHPEAPIEVYHSTPHGGYWIYRDGDPIGFAAKRSRAIDFADEAGEEAA